MKHLAILTLHFSLLTLHSSAAVPLRWTVDTSRAQPATFEAYQGETLAFEAALQSAGKPLELSGIAALYWQTNGMGSAYWETTAAVNSNRLSAVWTPEMDVGAKVYNCFIGVPGTIYHAAFLLRLRPSPGAEPNTLPLPVPVIDFAKVRVLNPPWGSGGGGVDTNAVRDIIRDEITPTTNSLYTTLNDSIGAKRDKDDLAVYEVVRTENTDWTWTSENAEFAHALNEAGTKPEWNGHAWWYVDLPSDYVINYPVETGRSVTSITYNVGKVAEIPVVATCTATRPRYMDEHGFTTSTNAILAEVVTNGTGKVTEGDLVKVGTNGRLVKATASDIPELPYLSAKNGGTVDGFVVFNGLVVCNSEIQPATVRAMAGDVLATVDGNIHNLSYKADRATTLSGYGITDAAPLSMISETDQTFSNAVATVARTVTPPQSPTLRLYDEVRQCYWIGRMVNGVINWEVE